MAIEKLKPLAVHKARDDGLLADGGGLYLCIRGASATWLLRYTAADGRRREMGLGTAERSTIALAAESLAEARRQAAAARNLLKEGKDPIAERKTKKSAETKEADVRREAEKAAAMSLLRVARAYHERVIEKRSRNAKHAAQWIRSIELYVPQRILDTPVGAITHAQLFGFLDPLMRRLPETATRVHQRLEVIFNDAIFHGYATTNPAAVIQQKLLDEVVRPEVESHAAVPWQECPKFMAQLREHQGVSARALEFLILTAARTNEVIGARWSEFDLDAKLWTAPKSRMKAGREHVVHLTPRAVEIVKGMAGIDEVFVFPSPDREKRALSNMAMLVLLKRRMKVQATVHGFRSSFSSWANEHGHRPDVIERALAHVESNEVRRAYDRSEHLDARRQLLEAWAQYLQVPAEAANEPEMKEAA